MVDVYSNVPKALKHAAEVAQLTKDSKVICCLKWDY